MSKLNVLNDKMTDKDKPGSEVIYLRRKIPTPLKIILWIGLPLILWGLILVVFITHQYLDGIPTILFVGGGPLFFMYSNDRGYRIAWDDEYIYQRNWGFRNFMFQRQFWHKIAFDNIKSIKGKTQNNPAAHSRYISNEYLEVKSQIKKTEDIWIYSLALQDDDVLPMLLHINERCPNMLPKGTIKKIESA